MAKKKKSTDEPWIEDYASRVEGMYLGRDMAAYARLLGVWEVFTSGRIIDEVGFYLQCDRLQQFFGDISLKTTPSPKVMRRLIDFVKYVDPSVRRTNRFWATKGLEVVQRLKPKFDDFVASFQVELERLQKRKKPRRSKNTEICEFVHGLRTKAQPIKFESMPKLIKDRFGEEKTTAAIEKAYNRWKNDRAGE